ncbi:hypothetical protein A4G28_16255 [Mycobacterium ostraviense]|uniref:Uncharacterized protein n=1 Tax=Mycobacterium ostraviense TaxID=2738409 RepID=A0A162E7B0_9MYCO|nr:hypothetical protein A4G28_16255 [Mycobacterium ostraviense]
MPLHGAAAGLAVMAAETQLGGTDNGPSDAALPTSAATADAVPAVNNPAAGATVPAPDSAEPGVATSLATAVVDELRSFATELTEDIADIVELIVEAAALAGDVNEVSRLRHSAKFHPELDAATGCASCCNARGTVEIAPSIEALTSCRRPRPGQPARPDLGRRRETRQGRRRGQSTGVAIHGGGILGPHLPVLGFNGRDRGSVDTQHVGRAQQHQQGTVGRDQRRGHHGRA